MWLLWPFMHNMKIGTVPTSRKKSEIDVLSGLIFIINLKSYGEITPHGLLFCTNIALY